MNPLKQLWAAFAALTQNVNATSETVAEVNAKLAVNGSAWTTRKPTRSN